jgi:hypothetical protein
MKVISLKDIADVKAEDVKPGMILAEGVVTMAHREVSRGKHPDVMWFYTAADGQAAWAEVGKAVQVYGRLNEALTEALLSTVKG